MCRDKAVLLAIELCCSEARGRKTRQDEFYARAWIAMSTGTLYFCNTVAWIIGDNARPQSLLPLVYKTCIFYNSGKYKPLANVVIQGDSDEPPTS